MGEIVVRNEAEMKEAVGSFAGQMAFVFATMRVGCRPCTAIAPTYTRLAAKITAHTDQIMFLKFDVTEATDLAWKFSVSATPTFFCLLENSEKARLNGGASERMLVEWVKEQTAGMK